MADAAQLDREDVFFEDRVGEIAAERNLGRGDEAQVAFGDAVDLRLGAARDVAGPVQTSLRARSGVIVGVKPSPIRRSIAYCCSASSSSTASFFRK
jgi:hypothetical protein